MSAAMLPGTVHAVPDDLATAFAGDAALLALWQSLTPLGRNEFLYWIEDAKRAPTRARRIRRTAEELREGKRRPCCWPGCPHRPDKPPSPWQRAQAAAAKAP